MPRFISISKDSDTLQRVKSCRSSTDSLRKSPTETVCTAAHGIHYNRGRERGAMVGKSPTATKLMLLTVVWGAAALTSSQTSFTDSIVLVALTEKETLGGINKVSSPIFPEQSLSFILLLYYYFCQVYTDMWRGKLWFSLRFVRKEGDTPKV